jgi:hypothetical protein
VRRWRSDRFSKKRIALFQKSAFSMRYRERKDLKTRFFERRRSVYLKKPVFNALSRAEKGSKRAFLKERDAFLRETIRSRSRADQPPRHQKIKFARHFNEIPNHGLSSGILWVMRSSD